MEITSIYEVLVEGKGLSRIAGYTVYQWVGFLIGGAVGVFAFWALVLGLWAITL